MSDDSLFREVDEEVRAERFQKLWKQYGAYVAGAAIGVVLAVAGINGWQYWKTKQAVADPILSASPGPVLHSFGQSRRHEAPATNPAGPNLRFVLIPAW